MKKSFTLCVLFFISLVVYSQPLHKTRKSGKTSESCTACINPTFATSSAEDDDEDDFEEYGGAINIGFGMGYYSYIDGVFPMMYVDYEFDIARNFTLAPFISIYSY